MNAEAIKNLVIYELSVIPKAVNVEGKKLKLVFSKSSLREGMTVESIQATLRKAIPLEMDIELED